MEKKRVKYFRVLVNQKEDKKQKSFLEKNKDSISAISSLCTVATLATAIITFSVQFWNSHQAANFYFIEQHYFFQISIWKILFDTIKLVLIKTIGWIFSLIVWIASCENSTTSCVLSFTVSITVSLLISPLSTFSLVC